MQDHAYKTLEPIPEFWHVVLYPSAIKNVRDFKQKEKDDELVYSAFHELGFSILREKYYNGKRELLIANKKKSSMTLFVLKYSNIVQDRMAEINTYYHNTKNNPTF